MKYVGSKNKIAKHILPIMLNNKTNDQYFVDLFCGGCNLIDKVDGLRIANDLNYYLIELFKALQKGWLPPKSINKNEYDLIRLNKELYPAYLVGYYGFCCSYNGKFFGGISNMVKTKDGKIRDYVLESFNNIMRQIKNLNNVQFLNKQYYDVEIPLNSIVYCDIPYKNTTKYSVSNFDYELFYNWCRENKNKYKIYISEYEMPDDFTELWSKEVNSSLNQNCAEKKAIEKLFTI